MRRSGPAFECPWVRVLGHCKREARCRARDSRRSTPAGLAATPHTACVSQHGRTPTMGIGAEAAIGTESSGSRRRQQTRASRCWSTWRTCSAQSPGRSWRRRSGSRSSAAGRRRSARRSARRSSSRRVRELPARSRRPRERKNRFRCGKNALRHERETRGPRKSGIRRGFRKLPSAPAGFAKAPGASPARREASRPRRRPSRWRPQLRRRARGPDHRQRDDKTKSIASKGTARMTSASRNVSASQPRQVRRRARYPRAALLPEEPVSLWASSCSSASRARAGSGNPAA